MAYVCLLYSCSCRQGGRRVDRGRRGVVEATTAPCITETVSMLLQSLFSFVRQDFFTCSALPSTVNFTCLNVFRNSSENIDFSSFLVIFYLCDRICAQ